MIASPAPRSILCVDNDPAFAHSVAAILSACEMVGATSGYEALRAFNARTFDL